MNFAKLAEAGDKWFVSFAQNMFSVVQKTKDEAHIVGDSAKKAANTTALLTRKVAKIKRNKKDKDEIQELSRILKELMVVVANKPAEEVKRLHHDTDFWSIIEKLYEIRVEYKKNCDRIELEKERQYQILNENEEEKKDLLSEVNNKTSNGSEKTENKEEDIEENEDAIAREWSDNEIPRNENQESKQEEEEINEKEEFEAEESNEEREEERDEESETDEETSTPDRHEEETEPETSTIIEQENDQTAENNSDIDDVIDDGAKEDIEQDKMAEN